MTPLWIRPLVCVLLYLTLHGVHGKHIISRKPNDNPLIVTKCYSCDNIRNPQDCHTTVDCPPNEICYVGGRVDFGVSGAYFNYSLGCKKRTLCKDLPTVQNRQINMGSICCHTSLCNDNFEDRIQTTVSSSTPAPTITPSMTVPNYNHLNATKCYSCVNIRNPQDCHTTVDCPPNEICYVGGRVDFGVSGAYYNYSLGCKHRNLCKDLPTVQNRQINFGSKCCHTSLCNDNFEDRIQTTVSSSTAAPTITPSMTDVCRNHPDVSCAYLMSINMCTAPVADRYCVEPCYNCIKTSQIPTRDPNTILG